MYFLRFSIVFLLLFFLEIMAVEPFRMRVTERVISHSQIPSDLSILWLSDFQLRNDSGYREKWIRRNLSNWKFDLICITGDVFDTNAGMRSATEMLEGLSKIKPTYVVLGNWEHWSGVDLASYRSDLEGRGVQVLVNENMQIAFRGKKFAIVGVDDPSELRDNLPLAMNGLDKNVPKILLAHAPSIFPRAASRDIDVILAGHTHGGQVVLPWIGPPYLPPGCDNYVYGKYEDRHSVMFVTSGVGTSILPIRFRCRPEIVLLNFR